MLVSRMINEQLLRYLVHSGVECQDHVQATINGHAGPDESNVHGNQKMGTSIDISAREPKRTRMLNGAQKSHQAGAQFAMLRFQRIALTNWSKHANSVQRMSMDVPTLPEAALVSVSQYLQG